MIFNINLKFKAFMNPELQAEIFQNPIKMEFNKGRNCTQSIDNDIRSAENLGSMQILFEHHELS
jgi:hypothetical protein